MREFTRVITMLFATIMASSVIAGTLHPDLVGKLQSSAEDDLIRIFISMENQADFSWLMSNTAALSRQEARSGDEVTGLNQRGPFCTIPALLWSDPSFGAYSNEDLQCQST